MAGRLVGLLRSGVLTYGRAGWVTAVPRGSPHYLARIWHGSEFSRVSQSRRKFGCRGRWRRSMKGSGGLEPHDQRVTATSAVVTLQTSVRAVPNAEAAFEQAAG
ncbi:hypothetical protein GCM10010256_41240 [Streptomyces coeruleorubidus]|nr:hypothetical protein GCM10010256_41240 [Streptomyces coeruleorubidus]